MNIIKIPRDLIYNKHLTDKRVAIYSYCTLNSGISNSCYTSCSTIISWCRMKMDRHSGSTNDKFSQALELFQEYNYINNFSKDTFRTASSIVEMNINRDKFFPKASYGIITQDEIKLLQDAKITNRRINLPIILLVLSYIRCNLTMRKKEESIIDRPEVFYHYINSISDDIGLSSSIILSSLDLLQAIGIIKVKQLPRYKKNGEWRTNVTLFANSYKYKDELYDYAEELKYGELLFNNSDYMKGIKNDIKI